MSNKIKTQKYCSIKNILIITLSNIGDAVLTLPVLVNLSVIFPQARITLLCGPRAVPVFIDDGRISEVIIYDKHISLSSKISLLIEQRAKRFDLIVDLRNTLIPLLLGARHRTAFWRRPPRNVVHKQYVHLWKLKSLGLDVDFTLGSLIWLSEADKNYAGQMLPGEKSSDKGLKMAALAPGARSHIKRWPEKYFIELGRRLLEETDIEKIILLGSKDEISLCREIERGIITQSPTLHDRAVLFSLKGCPTPDGAVHYPAGAAKNDCPTLKVKGCEKPEGLPKNGCEKPEELSQDRCLNLGGQTTLKQAAAIMAKCRLLVSNDSALMHMGSIVGIPVIAIFGPTDEAKYRPLSPKSQVVRKKLACTPCQSAQCRIKTHDCLQQLSPDDVFEKLH